MPGREYNHSSKYFPKQKEGASVKLHYSMSVSTERTDLAEAHPLEMVTS
jgi:hypothetical protein